LESIYADFDAIAKRRRVFKVEVVGDCYVSCTSLHHFNNHFSIGVLINSFLRPSGIQVAVCGLPDPRKKHAVVMAKFAADCMEMMALTVSNLELELGKLSMS
jgi:hypothetical protein